MVSARIKEICKREGVNVKTLANQIGMSQQALQRYTSDTSKPGYDFFVSMHGHGINLNWLISGEGDMYRPNLHPPGSSDEVENDDELVRQLLLLISSRLTGKQAQLAKPILDDLRKQQK